MLGRCEECRGSAQRGAAWRSTAQHTCMSSRRWREVSAESPSGRHSRLCSYLRAENAQQAFHGSAGRRLIRRFRVYLPTAPGRQWRQPLGSSGRGRAARRSASCKEQNQTPPASEESHSLWVARRPLPQRVAIQLEQGEVHQRGGLGRQAAQPCAAWRSAAQHGFRAWQRPPVRNSVLESGSSLGSYHRQCCPPHNHPGTAAFLRQGAATGRCPNERLHRGLPQPQRRRSCSPVRREMKAGTSFTPCARQAGRQAGREGGRERQDQRTAPIACIHVCAMCEKKSGISNILTIFDAFLAAWGRIRTHAWMVPVSDPRGAPPGGGGNSDWLASQKSE